MPVPSRLKALLARFTPRQQQYLTLAGIAAGGIGVLWLVLVFAGGPSIKPAPAPSLAGKSITPTNLGVQPPGQVNPVDQWIGDAGRKLAQYEADRDAQQRAEAARKANEVEVMQRLTELEKKQAGPVPAAKPEPSASAPAPAASNLPASVPPPPTPVGYPPAGSLPGALPAGVPVQGARATSPAGHIDAIGESEAPPMVRVTLAPEAAKAGAATPAQEGVATGTGDAKEATLDTFLPVSFTRGVLLGGIDAPTGGQAQGNPLPVLIRLVDNAVLPNAARANVKECFVIASGYGDISSERAYMRVSNLSCVRRDNSTLEVNIQGHGNVYGEDGKLGVRGRLVTKQGQILANALRAGIVGGIGQGFSQGGSSVTSSPFGTLATTSGGTADQMRHGIAGGVGRALDNLANYYIRLAEQTFPVIEVDAGRQVDVVLTRGVGIGVRRPRVAADPGDGAADNMTGGGDANDD